MLAIEQQGASKDKRARACRAHQCAAARPATKERLCVLHVSPFKRKSQGFRHLCPERWHEGDIWTRKSCSRPYRHHQPLTGVYAGTDTHDRHIKTCRRCPSGFCEVVRRAEGIEKSG
ncbi:MAG: hypothetical protein NTNFB02_18550 [Nitrospira sp.]